MFGFHFAALAIVVAAPVPATSDVERLIVQLGAPAFTDREAAGKAILAIGESALTPLRTAAATSTDAEIRRRATALAEAISRSLFDEVQGYRIHRGWATRILLTADGKQVLSLGFDGPRLWDRANGDSTRQFDATSVGHWGLAMSKDGRRAAATTGEKTVAVWDTQTGRQMTTLAGHTMTIWGVALSADGSWAASGGEDGTVRFRDVATGKETRQFKDLTIVRCLALSPDGRFLAGGCCRDEKTQPATIRVWDIREGKEVRALTGHTRAVSGLAFSPDGKTLASSSFDATVRLWDMPSGKLRTTLTGHSIRVESVAFSPDGARLVSCGNEQDGTLRVWDAASGRPLYTGSLKVGMLALAVADKTALVACKDGTVRYWRWTK